MDGDGFTEDDANTERHFAVLPDAADETSYPGHCGGYELALDLDFKSAASSASGEVNAKWISGNEWLPIEVLPIVGK